MPAAGQETQAQKRDRSGWAVARALGAEGRHRLERVRASTRTGLHAVLAWRRDPQQWNRDPSGWRLWYPLHHTQIALLDPAIAIPADALIISIDTQGTVSVTQPGATTPTVLGTVQLATFQNSAGLQAIGSNLFEETDASGPATVGNPGIDDRGNIQQGFLELSNVSVVEEMVNLITAQRAYEVNSRTVQTADEMLQIANTLKR